MFNHAIRTLVFGALVGQQQKITFDRELFFLGAIFHDLGLTERYGGLEKSPGVTAYTSLMELVRDHVHGVSTALCSKRQFAPHRVLNRSSIESTRLYLCEEVGLQVPA